MIVVVKRMVVAIVGFLPISLLAQDLNYYDFKFSVAYLPFGGSQSERYFKTGNKVERTYVGTYKKNSRRVKKKKLPIDGNIEKAIYLLDSLCKLKEFTFKINSDLRDSLKSRYMWKKAYNILDEDIDGYFSELNRITLKVNDLPTEFMETAVLDGAPYLFDLKYTLDNKDTLHYTFNGNLCDEVNTSNIKNWLSIYLTLKRYSIFNSITLFEDYFNNKRLEHIIFRFIVWKKSNE